MLCCKFGWILIAVSVSIVHQITLKFIQTILFDCMLPYSHTDMQSVASISHGQASVKASSWRSGRNLISTAEFLSSKGAL